MHISQQIHQFQRVQRESIYIFIIIVSLSTISHRKKKHPQQHQRGEENKFSEINKELFRLSIVWFDSQVKVRAIIDIFCCCIGNQQRRKKFRKKKQSQMVKILKQCKRKCWCRYRERDNWILPRIRKIGRIISIKRMLQLSSQRIIRRYLANSWKKELALEVINVPFHMISSLQRVM